MFLLLFIAFQIIMFIGIAVRADLVLISANVLQISVLFARYSVRFFYGAYPSSIEMFEYGVVGSSHNVFFPWNQVELRPSQYFEGQHALIILTPAGIGRSTYMVRFEGDLKERVELARSSTLIAGG